MVRHYYYNRYHCALPTFITAGILLFAQIVTDIEVFDRIAVYHHGFLTEERAQIPGDLIDRFLRGAQNE